MFSSIDTVNFTRKYKEMIVDINVFPPRIEKMLTQTWRSMSFQKPSGHDRKDTDTNKQTQNKTKTPTDTNNKTRDTCMFLLLNTMLNRPDR